MKKSLFNFYAFLMLGLLGSYTSLAQEISINTDTLNIEGKNTTNPDFPADLYKGFTFKNINATSDTFVWARRVNDLPSSAWESAFCDINLCHGSDVNAAEFVLQKGDSGVMFTHFYPGSGNGTAVMEVDIFCRENPLQKVTLVAFCTAWDALNSVSYASLETNLFYPNPAADGVLNFSQLAQHEGKVQIRNMEGKVLSVQNIQINQSSIDVSTLSQGMYLVEWISNGQTKVQKINKL
jgi:hypothetical protein